MTGLLKKPLSICQQEWRETRNGLLVIRWVHWGPGTNWPMLNYVQSVFTWRHDGHFGVPKQWNRGHVGVPNQSWGSWTLFLYKRFLLFQYICVDAGHVSENTLYDTGYYFVRQAITFLTSDFADVASTIPSAKRREVNAENQEKCLLIQFKQYFVDLFFVTRQSFVDELLINLCLDYMVTTSSAAKTSL